MSSEKVFRLLRKVPKGRVTTYKALAERAGTSPRAVGRAMARNRHPDAVPCFKVVRSDGSLGGYSGPGGVREKIRRLEREGIEVKKGKIEERYFFFG
ncbi:MAG: MGMT family protein [Candidatus Aenigmatarchaeota archaeon]